MGAILDVQGRVYVSESLPQASPDQGPAGETLIRGSKYGEEMVLAALDSEHVAALEGSYFVTPGSATPGTKLLLGAATTAFSDTAGVLYLFNTGQAGQKRALLRYIKLMGLLAHTSSTDALYWALITDTVRTPTTDNTTVLTPVALSTDLAPASLLTVKAQNSATSSAFPASNAGTKRVIAQGSFPRWVGVLGDEATIVFGSWHGAGAVQGLTAATAAVPGKFFSHAPGVVLGPQRSALLALWQPGNAVAPQAIFEMGHIER